MRSPNLSPDQIRGSLCGSARRVRVPLAPVSIPDRGAVGRRLSLAPQKPAVADLDQLEPHPTASARRAAIAAATRAAIVSARGRSARRTPCPASPGNESAAQSTACCRGHAVIDDVHDGFEHRCDDARAAGAAEHEDRPAVLFDERRRHRGERPLAGCDRVGLALDQTVQFGAPGLAVKSSISLLSKKPVPGATTPAPK